MSQSSSDKFLFFTVGLLKGSEALEALRQDAVKHHMIDNPGQLIALRLTEYYDMMSRKQEAQPEQVAPTSASQGVQSTPAPQTTTIVTPKEAEMRARQEQRPVERPERNSATEWRTPTPLAQSTHTATSFEVSPSMSAQPQAPGYSPTSQVTGRMRALMRDGENVVTTSTNADQNADDAADYWSTL